MRFAPILLLSALFSSAACTAAPPKSVGIGLGYPLAPGQAGAATRSSLSALSFGTATLTSSIAAGATIEAIVGTTAGSSLSLSGSDVSSGYLALSGAFIVRGATAPPPAGTVLTNYAVTETLAGAIGSPRTTAGYPITVTGGFVPGTLDFSNAANSGLNTVI